MEKSTREMVVEWLNEAVIAADANLKVQNLCKVQELVLSREPLLLQSCLGEILQFAVDRDADVRKSVAGLIEAAGAKAPETIPKTILTLTRLVADTTPVVAKHALRAAAKVVKAALQWASSAPVFTPDMEMAWLEISGLKMQVVNMIDSENDGIRTQAIKFLERVILIQSYAQPDSPKKADDFSLEDVPLTLSTIRRRNLEGEANHLVDLLTKFFLSEHISSINLITCLGSLSLIAKARPQYMSEVTKAIQNLLGDLPPTLTESQVTSLQKQLKLTLMGLIKHPACFEHSQIVSRLLLRLGCKVNEVAKYVPDPEDSRKPKKRKQVNAAAQTAKRPRMERTVIMDEPVIVPKKVLDLVEMLEGYVAERLSLEVATELVMSSLPQVPDRVAVPPTFVRDYKQTSTTDMTVQRRVVAKLLAGQIKASKCKPETRDEQLEFAMQQLVKDPSVSVAEARKERQREKELQAKAALEAQEKIAAKSWSRAKALRLSEVTKPLTKDARDKMLLMAVERLLEAEKSLGASVGASSVRTKILTTLAATFNPCVKELILRHICADMGARLDLALCWLYEEYALLKGFQRRTILHQKPHEGPHQVYNDLLCRLVSAIDNVAGMDWDALLARLYLEAPLITEDALQALKTVSSEASRALAPLRRRGATAGLRAG